tara:strand:+ start:80 stop:280 length:201 start_codon:yes stop_codon:yes gene_type:complete
VGNRPVGLRNFGFVWAGGGGRGEQHNPPIFTIQLFTLSLKDITRVISRSRDRLVEIRVIGYCHICK